MCHGFYIPDVKIAESMGIPILKSRRYCHIAFPKSCLPAMFEKACFPMYLPALLFDTNSFHPYQSDG